MKIKKLILDYAKKNLLFRRYARGMRDMAARAVYSMYRIIYRADKNTVFFNAFSGRSFSDSPKAIYESMICDERFENYKFIWSFADPERYRYLEKDRRTRLVRTGSPEEKRMIARSGYWICNYRMPDCYFPGKDQTYVQCWHGTPLKRLGYDLIYSDNSMNTLDEIKKKYRRDAMRMRYFISPSAYASEKFASAWNLKEYGRPDTIIEEGYPRNDRLINCCDNDRTEIHARLGTDPGKKVILYAPTWRDDQHDSRSGYVYEPELDFDMMRRHLGDGYIILFRAHYLVSNSFDFDRYSGFIYDVSAVDDINDLYLISDILVTDYSSVFFDYTNLRRPVIFYMYDLEAYRDRLRGFYTDLSELPGSVTVNGEQLLKEIRRCSDWKPDEKYEEFCRRYNCLDDGNAAGRVTERIFGEVQGIGKQ